LNQIISFSIIEKCSSGVTESSKGASQVMEGEACVNY
jgi:hypothetical protein